MSANPTQADGMKATPGPWHATRRATFISTISNQTLAELREPTNKMGGTKTANASLMAAAPDLYEALKLARSVRTLDELTSEQFASIEAALAKAGAA